MIESLLFASFENTYACLNLTIGSTFGVVFGFLSQPFLREHHIKENRQFILRIRDQKQSKGRSNEMSLFAPFIVGKCGRTYPRRRHLSTSEME